MIDKDRLKNSLSIHDIIAIVSSLGSDAPRTDNKNNSVFQTVCHNANPTGSYKLYYYENTKLFTCYTECQTSFDIFDLVTKHKKLTNSSWEFRDSLNYVGNFVDKTFYMKDYTIPTDTRINDWDFLNRYKKVQFNKITLPTYSPYILDIYHNIYHKSWLNEGITPKAMQKFNIKFDSFNNKIIIPHYDIQGNLIGIRGRSLNIDDINAGRKYMPVKVENTICSHPISYNIYGLYQNLNTIKRLKKALIVEGEKSVLKVESYYPENNFSIAICGDKISDYQREMILKYVDEVIIGFDKTETYKKLKSESILNLKKIADKFTPYVKTFIIVDKTNLLDIKSAPVDHGKDVLETLMKNKIEIKTI